MVGILTMLTDAPALVTDIGAAIVAIEQVLPVAEAAEQAVLAAVLTPLQKIKTDVEAMPAEGASPKAIVTDVETFFTDLAGVAAALETLIPTIESKVESVWQQLAQPVNQVKTDVESLLPAAPAAVTTAA
jgi:hypothetical protein